MMTKALKRGFYVLENRSLGQGAFVLRFERNGLEFKTGQYLLLSPKGAPEAREYSIYSPQQAPYLEVLIKKVPQGRVSLALSALKQGDELFVQGPFGYFLLDPQAIETNRQHLFVATGTGISPFHSMALTYPQLNYQLVHGVRTADECYESLSFEASRYTSCLTQSTEGSFQGRVTAYLERVPFSATPDLACYLCGNCDMIYDVFDFLRSKGISSADIHSEVYF